MEEKRAHPRLEEQFRVVVTLLSPDEQAEAESQTFYCSTNDISAEGLRFRSHESIPVGTSLDLLIVLTWSYYGFQFKGRVVWVIEEDAGHAYTIGVKLLEAPPAARIAWHDALEDRLQLEEQGRN